jgi:hypothetical protein
MTSVETGTPASIAGNTQPGRATWAVTAAPVAVAEPQAEEFGVVRVAIGAALAKDEETIRDAAATGFTTFANLMDPS